MFDNRILKSSSPCVMKEGVEEVGDEAIFSVPFPFFFDWLEQGPINLKIDGFKNKNTTIVQENNMYLINFLDNFYFSFKQPLKI